MCITFKTWKEKDLKKHAQNENLKYYDQKFYEQDEVNPFVDFT